MQNGKSKASPTPAGKMPAGKAMGLPGMAAYGRGAIVSRTLVQNAAGTVTLFAFDKGQELSEHTAPFDALVQVLDGEARITVGGKPHAVAAGEAILMPANVPHALRATRRFKMLLTMLRAAGK